MSNTWYTVSGAKVVSCPIRKIDENGKEKTFFIRMGIRVDMVDGSWWFNHFKYKTWSRHYVAKKTVGKGYNAVSVPVDCTDSYTQSKLEREYATRKQLLDALRIGTELALIEEAEKRAAA